MVAKRKSKILGQPSEALLNNFGLYVLFIHIEISIFSKKACNPGGLIFEKAYNRRDLHVSNLVDLYSGRPRTGRVFNWDFVVYTYHIILNYDQ